MFSRKQNYANGEYKKKKKNKKKKEQNKFFRVVEEYVADS